MTPNEGKVIIVIYVQSAFSLYRGRLFYSQILTTSVCVLTRYACLLWLQNFNYVLYYSWLCCVWYCVNRAPEPRFDISIFFPCIEISTVKIRHSWEFSRSWLFFDYGSMNVQSDTSFIISSESLHFCSQEALETERVSINFFLIDHCMNFLSLALQFSHAIRIWLFETFQYPQNNDDFTRHAD